MRQGELDKQLLNATEIGDLGKVKELVISGADINCKDDMGWYVLANVCWFRHKEILRFLLDSGCEVNSKGHNGDTAILLAGYAGDKDIVKMLLERGSDISITNDFGDNGLSYHKKIWSDYDVQELIINKQPHNIKLLSDSIGILPELMEKYKDIMELAEMGLF